MGKSNKDKKLSGKRRFGQAGGKHSVKLRKRCDYHSRTDGKNEERRNFQPYQLVRRTTHNGSSMMKFVVRRIPLIRSVEPKLIALSSKSLKYKLFHSKKPISGYRIINTDALKAHVSDIAAHTCLCDAARNLVVDGKSPVTLQSEKCKNGLFSVIVAVCEGCGTKFDIKTSHKLNNGLYDINVRAVWGAMSSGVGATDLNEQLGTMNVPSMNSTMFTSIEEQIGSWWLDALKDEMGKAGAEEQRMAIEKGNYDEGIPAITVICDGGWSKRTHKHSYNAYGGVAVIFGAQTKKLLYIGVRKKFCMQCTRAKNKGVQAEKHNCFKNWTESSQAMESDILVNGFLEAESMHGIRYTKIIADGDSSVFAQLQEKVPWGRRIEKLECANHTVKCLRSNLEKLVNEKPHYKEKGKLTKLNRIKLSTAVRCAIKMRTNDGNLNQLRKDIINSIYHVLGFHERCSDFCTKRKCTDDNENDSEEGPSADNFDDIFEAQFQFWSMPSQAEMENSRTATKSQCSKEELKSIIIDVQVLLNRISEKSHRLIGNFTTNLCESWMAIRAKFDGGKVINRCGKASWHARCYGGALRKNLGITWSPLTFQNVTNEQAGQHFWNNARRVSTIAKATKKYQEKESSKDIKRKRKLGDLKQSCAKKAKFHYGSQLDDTPDVKSDKLIERCETFIQTNVKKSKEEIDDIQNRTVDQNQSTLWRSERKIRLTSSNFGKVMHRRPTNVSNKIVKSMLYSTFTGNINTIRGLAQEENTIIEYKNKTNNEVTKTGMKICENNNILGASTDGIVHTENSEGLIEIKNFLQNNNYLFKEAVSKVPNFCLENHNNRLQLKRSHDIYYQIQGQLNIFNKEWCDFVLRRTNPYEIYIERIKIDRQLWEHDMLPKWTDFYDKFLLPELALPRFGTYTGIREPKSPWFQKPPSNDTKKKRSTLPKTRNTDNDSDITDPEISHVGRSDSQVPSTSSCRPSRSRRSKLTVKFVGRHILHEWTIDAKKKKTKWYRGTVLDVISGKDGDVKAVYEVIYEGEDTSHEVDKLGEDLETGSLKFVDI